MTALTPFISRQDLTDYLGRSLNTDAAALIAVDAAVDTVRTLTEQDFNPVNGDTVVLDGTGTDTLLLPQRPVRACGTVVVNGGTLDATLDYTFTEYGHLYRTDGTATLSSWPQTSSAIGYWPQGRRNVTVVYDRGYSTNGSIDVPADVRMVAVMIASRMLVQGVDKRRTVGQSQVEYAVASTDLTENERRILRKYKASL